MDLTAKVVNRQNCFFDNSGNVAQPILLQTSTLQCHASQAGCNAMQCMQCIPSSVAAPKTTISIAQEKVCILCAPAILSELWRGDLVDQNYLRIGGRQCNLLQTLKKLGPVRATTRI